MIEVPFWGYRCVLSVAQIMIMSADVPHTLFLKREEDSERAKEKDGGKSIPKYDPYKPIDPDDPCIRLNAEARRMAEEREKGNIKMEPVLMEDLLNF